MQVPTNDKTNNNFRFCCKCKDYIDSSQFQNSELEKSKSGVCNKHTNTPEPPDTLRFCRKCNKHIPVSLFHSGQKRFMCKKHCAIRIAAKCIKNQTDIPGKANSDRAWKICYRDSKKFPNTKMNLTKKEILHILLEADPLSKNDFILLPINPSVDVSKTNVIVLEKKNRNTLIKLISKGNIKEYHNMIQSLVSIELPK